MSSSLWIVRFSWSLPLVALFTVGNLCGGEVSPIGQPAGALKGPVRLAKSSPRPASDEPKQALKLFVPAEGFVVDLFAAEPLLGNPVSLHFDNQGRLFVAETHRYRTSTLDVRNYPEILEADLLCRSLEDRLALMKKFFPKDWEKLGIESEVIRLLEDRDHDGRADFSAIYAQGFHSVLDGVASGVLAHNGNVYLADIPSLWKLEGIDAGGHAEKRSELFRGFGVRFGLTGHDLHGLIVGPDGRLYFSVGDRGSHLKTKEGKIIDLPDEGAVFRCELDGSGLEVFCRGLRNPQDLAFDKLGNLFTADNDSDQGDRERFLYLIEGGDYGWRIGWQYHPIGRKHNPWLAEKLWLPEFEGQSASVLPPIANLPDGPAGLVYNPGTGLNDQYAEHFFLCCFQGSSAQSKVTTWKSRRYLSSFRLDDESTFLDHCQATDITFGPDSKIYLSEWGEGWDATGRGRIFRVYHPGLILAPQVEEVRLLLAEGFKDKVASELSILLGHRDQRVRLAAEWELAARPDGATELSSAAEFSPKDAQEPQLARIHAVWGLGIAARHAEKKQAGSGAEMLLPLLPLLADPDDEVRGQVARVLGENRVAEAYEGLMKALRDPVDYVSFFAAQGLAKLHRKECVSQVLLMARTNSEHGPFIRHAYVDALAASGDFPAIEEAAQHVDPAVRLVALLVMRRLERPEIARFLQDESPLLVLEAARAIFDLPIVAAMPSLAALIAKPTADEPLTLRILSANFRLGTPVAAESLAQFAAKRDQPLSLRMEALQLLSLWSKPPPRERVTGLFRPLPPRDSTPAAVAMEKVRAALFQAEPEICLSTLRAISATGDRAATADLHALFAAKTSPPKVQVALLETLATLDDPQLPATLETAFASEDPLLRIAAFGLIGTRDPVNATTQIALILSKGTGPEKQAAIKVLGSIVHPSADLVLVQLLTQLTQGKIPEEVQVELLEAAALHHAPAVQAALKNFRSSRSKTDPLAPFLPALTGGDRDAGATIFFEHPAVSCQRCHQLGDSGGGLVGPNLTGIASRQKPLEILQSVVLPNIQIANGFQMVVVTLKNHQVHAGLLKGETPKTLTIEVPGAPPLTIQKSEVASRQTAPSAMPADIGSTLSLRELRDLMAFLSVLRN